MEVFDKKNAWVTAIFVAVLFFVVGQVYLRKSFDKDSDYLTTWVLFSATVGICVIVSYITMNAYSYSTSLSEPIVLGLRNTTKIIDACIAGIFFGLGNLFWIYSISTKNPIGNIRTIMAGFETLCLFIAGYLVFSETIHCIQGLGVVLILGGIYLIGSN